MGEIWSSKEKTRFGGPKRAFLWLRLVDGEGDGAGGGRSGVGDGDVGGAGAGEIAGGAGYGEVGGIDPGGGAVGAVPGDGCCLNEVADGDDGVSSAVGDVCR